MTEDNTIVFDPLGELLKVVEEIDKAKEEGEIGNGLQT